MKILGIFLIVVGIVCFAVAVTGLLAWMTPVAANATPASTANSIGAQMLLFSGAGAVCIIGGVVALVLGIKKSRDRKRQGMKAGIRRLLAVSLVAVTILAFAVFATFKVMTRWNPDEEWAAKVIEESTEVRHLLEKYREEKGEFPMSLSEIDEVYIKPTDYYSQNGAAAATGKWHYDRIDAEDYQLFVTAYSWVSYFDAMVYRHSGAFTEPWFFNSRFVPFERVREMAVYSRFLRVLRERGYSLK